MVLIADDYEGELSIKRITINPFCSDIISVQEYLYPRMPWETIVALESPVVEKGVDAGGRIVSSGYG